MINLSLMRDVQIDVPGHRVRAQGGVLLGEVDRKTQAVGLATTLGTATDTGIAGLTLGGGIGRLMRPFGLACDNLTSAQIVTADGQLRHLSESDNPDLFWAIRGGGGNFGVVTGFEYRLHPLDHPVLSANGSYPYDQAHAVLKAVTDLAADMPDAMTLGVELSNDERGRQVTWSAFHCGDPKEGERLLGPLKKLGTTLRDRMHAQSYLAAQGVPDNAPLAVPQAPASYERHGYIHGGLTDAFFDELVRRFASVPPSLECFASLGQFGGAVGRVRSDATAYFNRAAAYGLLLGDSWAGRLAARGRSKGIPRGLGRPGALHQRLLHQRRLGGHRPARARDLWRELSASGAREDAVRSDQPVQSERQHQARPNLKLREPLASRPLFGTWPNWVDCPHSQCGEGLATAWRSSGLLPDRCAYRIVARNLRAA